MNIKVRLSSVLLITAVCVLIFAAYVSRANAVGQEELAEKPSQSNPSNLQADPVPGGPGFVSIAGGTFRPTLIYYEWESYWGGLANPSSTLMGEYIAPILLPNGATVTQVVAYYYDNAEENNLWVSLYRVNMLTTQVDTMAEFYSISNSYNWTYWYDDSVEYATIDNQTYSYYASVWLPAGQKTNLTFGSLRVDYGFPNYVPLVNK